jgi:hypothetical protein
MKTLRILQIIFLIAIFPRRTFGQQDNFVKDEDAITTRNLKTDSILPDKKIVGFYAARFACMDCGSDLELYFQYKDKREYLTIDRKKLNPFQLISKIKFFLTYIQMNLPKLKK